MENLNAAQIIMGIVVVITVNNIIKSLYREHLIRKYSKK